MIITRVIYYAMLHKSIIKKTDVIYHENEQYKEDRTETNKHTNLPAQFWSL